MGDTVIVDNIECLSEEARSGIVGIRGETPTGEKIAVNLVMPFALSASVAMLKHVIERLGRICADDNEWVIVLIEDDKTRARRAAEFLRRSEDLCLARADEIRKKRAVLAVDA